MILFGKAHSSTLTSTSLAAGRQKKMGKENEVFNSEREKNISTKMNQNINPSKWWCQKKQQVEDHYAGCASLSMGVLHTILVCIQAIAFVGTSLERRLSRSNRLPFSTIWENENKKGLGTGGKLTPHSTPCKKKRSGPWALWILWMYFSWNTFKPPPPPHPLLVNPAGIFRVGPRSQWGEQQILSDQQIPPPLGARNSEVDKYEHNSCIVKKNHIW